MTIEELQALNVELKTKLKEQEIKTRQLEERIKEQKEEYKILQKVNNKLVLLSNAEAIEFREENKNKVKTLSYSDLINKINNKEK